MKVGDKVTVRTWQSMAEQYGVDNKGKGVKLIRHNGDCFINTLMGHTCGEELRITAITEIGYELEGSSFTFQDWMFE